MGKALVGWFATYDLSNHWMDLEKVGSSTIDCSKIFFYHKDCEPLALARRPRGVRSGPTANDSTVRRTLEAAGVEFIDENGGGPGVRLRKSSQYGKRK